MFKSVKGKDMALNPKIPRKSCFEVGICFLSFSHINQWAQVVPLNPAKSTKLRFVIWGFLKSKPQSQFDKTIEDHCLNHQPSENRLPFDDASDIKWIRPLFSCLIFYYRKWIIILHGNHVLHVMWSYLILLLVLYHMNILMHIPFISQVFHYFSTSIPLTFHEHLRTKITSPQIDFDLAVLRPMTLVGCRTSSKSVSLPIKIVFNFFCIFLQECCIQDWNVIMIS